MLVDSHVAACLSAQRALSADLTRELRSLSEDVWNGPTNCPPWRMRDLATHIVGSGQGSIDAIRAGLAGSLEPAIPPEQRTARQAWSAAASPAETAEALEKVTLDFTGLYGGLDERQLDTICFHRRGNRSVRWYAAHRLAEVAFHGWDLRTSLGHQPAFDEHVAELLLPTLLESNAPRTYAAGLSAERGRGERFRLGVSGAPAASWLVTVDPERLIAVRDGGPEPDVLIAGSAASLALLVYGRLELHSARLSIEGDPAVAERFVLIFPRP